jgi:glucosamine kinase
MLLGVDAGGTGSRAVLISETGAVLGTGTAGPGNPSLLGAAAATAIGTAVRAALGVHDPARVTAAVAGVAGISGLAAVHDAFEREWKDIGLTCEVPIVGDAVTAYAAGSDAPAGAVLIAGTGAVAARVDGLDVVAVADGLGWLLGDEGSGTWIGLQAVRAAARAPHGPLGAAILRATGTDSSDALVNWAGRQAPAAFAALCPLVCGTPGAEPILDAAADRLLATLSELDDGGPVVLAGTLLTAGTPVRHRILAALGDRATVASDPALGAARLAGGSRARAGTRSADPGAA